MDEENIRPPDKVIVERLIDIENDYTYTYNNNENNNYYDNDNEFNPESIYEKELLDALNLSKQEFKNIEIPKNTVIEEQMKIINKLKTQMNKLIAFDKNNVYYYEMILTILELYANNYITVYNIENDYEKAQLFSIVKQTRISKEELELLEQIIQ